MNGRVCWKLSKQFLSSWSIRTLEINKKEKKREKKKKRQKKRNKQTERKSEGREKEEKI